MVSNLNIESFNAFSQIEQVGNEQSRQLLQDLIDLVDELEEVDRLLTVDERSVMAYDLAAFSLLLFSILNTCLAGAAISLPENPLTDFTITECILALVSAIGFFILMLNRGAHQAKASIYHHDSLATIHSRRKEKQAVMADIFDLGVASQLISTEIPVSELSESQKSQASTLLSQQLKGYLKASKGVEKKKRVSRQSILINRLVETALIVGDELPEVNIEQLIEEPKKEEQAQNVPS